MEFLPAGLCLCDLGFGSACVGDGLLFLLLLLKDDCVATRAIVRGPPFRAHRKDVRAVSGVRLSPARAQLAVQAIFHPR